MFLHRTSARSHFQMPLSKRTSSSMLSIPVRRMGSSAMKTSCGGIPSVQTCNLCTDLQCHQHTRNCSSGRTSSKGLSLPLQASLLIRGIKYYHSLNLLHFGSTIVLHHPECTMGDQPIFGRQSGLSRLHRNGEGHLQCHCGITFHFILNVPCSPNTVKYIVAGRATHRCMSCEHSPRRGMGEE